MSILLNGLLVREAAYTLTSSDVEYNNLMQVLYDLGVSKDLITKAWNAEERGKDSSCYIKEMFFWNSLVKYLVNMKDAFYHIKCPTQASIDQLEIDYDIKCIRNTSLCKFNGTDIFDALYQKLGVSIDGISQMVIQLELDQYGCQYPFRVYAPDDEIENG